MTYEVVSDKFTANLMTRKPGGPPSHQAATNIPKGRQIVRVESKNPDHVEFTIGTDRYWTFKTMWNDASVKRVS